MRDKKSRQDVINQCKFELATVMYNEPRNSHEAFLLIGRASQYLVKEYGNRYDAYAPWTSEGHKIAHRLLTHKIMHDILESMAVFCESQSILADWGEDYGRKP